MDCSTHDWRGGGARKLKGAQNRARFPQGPGFFYRGIQGPATYASSLDPAASSADFACGWPYGGFGLAARRIPASGLGTRYAWRGSTRDQMQAALKGDGG